MLNHLSDPCDSDAREASTIAPDDIRVILAPLIPEPERQRVVTGRAAATIVPMAAPDDFVLRKSLPDHLSGIGHLVACRFAIDVSHRELPPP